MVDHCTSCGTELRPGAKFCGKCGALTGRTLARVGTSDGTEIVSRSGGGSWTAVNRMTQGIALGTDEQIVKQYRIGRYTLRQGSIDVIVTNKRAIRFEDSNWLGMKTHRLDEINIDAVHGTSCTLSRSISILGILFSLACIIFWIFSLNFPFSGINTYGWVALAVALIIIVNSLRPTLIFSLHGSVGNAALDTSVNVMGRLFGRNTSSIIFQFKPTEETTVMLKEIGAMIYDLKTLGDKAINKWK